MAGVKRAAGFVIYKRIQNTIQFLLLQTSYGEHHWTPPKGHVDPGESDMETAIRETMEESGLAAADLKIFEDKKVEVNYLVKKKPKIVVYWLAELTNPNAAVKLSDEHQDFKWLELKEACDIAKYKEMQDVLQKFASLIK